MAINENSIQATQDKMKAMLGDFISESEIEQKAALVYKINQLKKERKAIILGHNYMEPVLYHTVPDYVGDSLELSRKAAHTEKDVIVFCGVEFMAETAKILSPDKTILVPSTKAGCSLAESITAEDVRQLKKRYPGIPVVTYVNTYADVKAESDYCCTSGNAKQVVEFIDSDRIIFLPDEYLAGNVAAESGKTIIFPEKSANGTLVHPEGLAEYDLIGWRGRCEVHEQFSVRDIKTVRKQYPDVVVLAHPECSPEVVQASDYAASTSKMIDYIKTTDAPYYLLLTESSMAENIVAENPEKNLVRVCDIKCPHMKLITLEETFNSLKYMRYEIEVPEDIRKKAKKAVDRMLEIS
ncbi:quinolinate synthase NadA [candidate division KSB1 bacterium]|nr:quinolinate synthase NadA [candidate division KSB1 bacterium]